MSVRERRRMRILWYARKYLDTSLDRGTWVEMTRALSEKADVQLVTGYRRSRSDFGLGEHLRYLPSLKLPYLNFATFILSAWIALPRDVRRSEPDVIVVDQGSYPAVIPMLLVPSRLRPRIVLDVRTLPVKSGGVREILDWWSYRFALAVAARFFDGISTITPALAESIAREAGWRSEDIGVWTSGVAGDVFNPETVEDQRRHPFEFVLIYHGTLAASRGLIDALHALKSAPQEVGLVMIGSGPDQKMISEQVVALGLEDRVRLHQSMPQSELAAAISAADCGLLPFPDLECWRVSSPLKLLEYLAMARPVIVTDLPCHRSVLGDEPYAVYAQSSQPEDLGAAISAAFADRERLRRAAERGRDVVLRDYSWEGQAEKFTEYLGRARREAS